MWRGTAGDTAETDMESAARNNEGEAVKRTWDLRRGTAGDTAETDMGSVPRDSRGHSGNGHGICAAVQKQIRDKRDRKGEEKWKT